MSGRRMYADLSESASSHSARDVVKGLYDLGRRGSERAHYARLEEGAVALLADALAYRVIRKRGKTGVKVVFAHGRVGRLRETEHIKQGVCGENYVRFVQRKVVDGVVHKVGDVDLGKFLKRFAWRHKTP